MKKPLILLRGTMGVGKTTVCRALLQRLDGCFWLDGDWCWTMHPFVMDDETKALVLDNIVHTLTGFLRCSRCRAALFSWVLDRPEVLAELRARLPSADVRVFTLTARPEILADRIARDTAAGLRTPGVLARSLSRRFSPEDGEAIDTSDCTAEQAAEEILRRLAAGGLRL